MLGTNSKSLQKIVLVLNFACATLFLIVLLNSKTLNLRIRNGNLETMDIANVSASHRRKHMHSYTRKIIIETLYPIVLTQSYKINNKNICEKTKKLTCIVVVYSSPHHFVRRNILRRTFLNATSRVYEPETIRVVYLLGLVTNSTLQTQIEDENFIHGDIVQGYFMDSYRNLTNKGVMGLKWITENCRNAEFALKMDDDVFVNLPRAFEQLPFLKRREKYYLACDRVEPDLYPIMRKKSDQWYVHEDKFKRMLRYPYVSCLGPAVFISIDLVPVLFKLASMSPFFWIDDVYLFGILPSKISSVTHFEINVTYQFSKAFECFLKDGVKCPLIVGMPNPRNESLVPLMWNSFYATITKRKQNQQHTNTRISDETSLQRSENSTTNLGTLTN